jgi:hypothetical protein
MKSNIILLLILLTSCDASKRISRIIKRNPHLISVDTVWRVDTIIVGEASKDSTFHFYQHDTIVLKKENLTVKYFFNRDSTVYISGKCDADTIYKYYPVQVNKIEVLKTISFLDKIKIFIFDYWWIFAIIFYIIIKKTNILSKIF